MPRRLVISRLLSPSLRSCFISGTSLPAVTGRPCGFPSFLACSIPAFMRSRKISRSNSANTASLPPGRRDERLPPGAFRGPGPHVFNLDGDGPTPLFCIVPHRQELQGQCLLVVGGDASVEPDAKRFCPLSKNPLAIGG